MSLAEAAVLTLWIGLLVGTGIWDFRRTFRPVEPPRIPVEPVDFDGEIRAYKIARDRADEKAQA